MWWSRHFWYSLQGTNFRTDVEVCRRSSADVRLAFVFQRWVCQLKLTGALFLVYVSLKISWIILYTRVGTDHDQKGDLVVVGSCFLLHDTTRQKFFCWKWSCWSWSWFGREFGRVFGRILVVFCQFLVMILWFSTLFFYFFPKKIQILLKIVFFARIVVRGRP